MFTFNLLSMLETIRPKSAKQKHLQDLHDVGYESYTPASPGEIRKSIERLSRCSNCHFIIFDNYWLDEVGNASIKVCPTCGDRT